MRAEAIKMDLYKRLIDDQSASCNPPIKLFDR